MVEAFNQLMTSPLSNYNGDATDMYISALSVAYEVNVTIIQADAMECRTFKVDSNGNKFAKLSKARRDH